MDHPIRIVLAKLGFDGHDRGLKVVARTLRDAGMEVIYLGLRQTPETVLATVEQEDADAVGISMLNGGHMALSRRMLAAMEEAGIAVPLIVGGIIPEDDRRKLLEMGVAAILGPGASDQEVAEAVHAAVAARSSHPRA